MVPHNNREGLRLALKAYFKNDIRVALDLVVKEINTCKLDPDAAFLLVKIALLTQNSKLFHDAIDLIRKAFPDSDLSKRMVLMVESEEFSDILQVVLSAAPNESLRRALEFYELKQYREAFTYAKSVLNEKNQALSAFCLLVEIAIACKNTELANILLGDAKKLYPEALFLQVLSAKVCLMSGMYEEASLLAEAMLRKEPCNLTYLKILIGVYEAQDCREKIINLLEITQTKKPDSTIVAIWLLDAYKKTGNVLGRIRQQRRILGCYAEIAKINPAKRPIKVGFLVQYPQGWSSLESVWKSMLNDPAFEACIMAAPFTHAYETEGGQDGIYSFFEKEKVPYIKWDNQPLSEDFVDILFIQNPYEANRPIPLRTLNLLQLVPRLAYVPYGIEIGGSAKSLENQFNQVLQKNLWAWYARSPRHKLMIAKHCSMGAANVSVTGSPRMDILKDLNCLEIDSEFVEVSKGRKIIIWNPQYDVCLDGSGYSTFLMWYDFLVSEFERRNDLVFVIRPHPLFFGSLGSRGIWTQEQIDGFLYRIEAAENILIDRRSSYVPVFAASDAMISDASSFLIEYGITKKPLLYLENTKGPPLNDDGNFIKEFNYTGLSKQDITNFLDMVSCGEDPNGEARNAQYGNLMTIPEKGVANAIKEDLQSRILFENRGDDFNT